MEFNPSLTSNGRFCMPIAAKVINSDALTDFSLPENYPEIRRVLYVSSSFPAPSKFIGGNKLDVNGEVEYMLVYIGTDGRLYSAPFSGEYSFVMTLDSIGDYDLSDGYCLSVKSVCDSSNTRLLSGRKVQVRSKISSDAALYGKRLGGERISGIENSDSIQYLRADASNADLFCEVSELLVLNDEYTLPSADMRVVTAEGKACVDKCKIDGEMIHISGEVVLKLLLSNDGDMRSERVYRKIPFDAECELDGVFAFDDALCRSDGKITNLNITTEEGRVLSEAGLSLEIYLCQNRPVGYTKDVYSTEQTVECKYEMLEVPVMLENKNAQLSVSERIDKSELVFPEGAEIIDISGSAVIDSAENEDGKYILRGNCKYHVIYYAEGDYGSFDMSVPLKYEYESSGDLCSCHACADILNCRVREEGEYISVDSELCLGMTLLGCESVKVLESAVFGETHSNPENEWRVCFISGEEDIWDIAKRYGVTQDSINGNPQTDRFILIE